MDKVSDKLFEITEYVKPNTPWDIEEDDLFANLEQLIDFMGELGDLQEDYEDVTTRLAGSLDEFKTWLRAQGVPEAEEYTIEDFGAKGNGIRMKKDVKKGELVISVPHKIVITEQTAMASNPVFKDDPLLKNMPSLLLAVHLLAEAAREDSLWAPYIRILPVEFMTPFYLTMDDIEHLRGSPTVYEIHKCLKNALRQYCFLYKSMEHEGVLTNWLSWQNFSWALSVIMTRQNQIPVVRKKKKGTPTGTTMCLIPLWDMCNHTSAPGSEITTFVDGATMNTECNAVQDFSAGDEFLIFYGKRPNWELLVHSGFTIPSNEYDVVKVTLGLEAGDPMAELKTMLLKNLNIAPRCQFLLNGADIDPNVMAFLRICSLDKDELKGHGVILEGKAVSVRNDVCAYKMLARACKKSLGAYPSSIEEDDEILAELSDQWGFQLKCLLTLRRSEKSILTFNRNEAIKRMLAIDPTASPEEELPASAPAGGAKVMLNADGSPMTAQQIKNKKKKDKKKKAKAAKRKEEQDSASSVVVRTWSTRVRDKGDLFKVVVSADHTFEGTHLERVKGNRTNDSHIFSGDWEFNPATSSLTLTSKRVKYNNGQDKFYSREDEREEIFKCTLLEEGTPSLEVMWPLGVGKKLLVPL